MIYLTRQEAEKRAVEESIVLYDDEFTREAARQGYMRAYDDLKAEMGSTADVDKVPEHCPKCSEVPWTEEEAIYAGKVDWISQDAGLDAFIAGTKWAEKRIKERG